MDKPRPGEPSHEHGGLPVRVDVARIGGDIYVNGVKRVFAVDFSNPPTANPQFVTVDWLLGWAKIGLMSKGHTVPHFAHRATVEFEADK